MAPKGSQSNSATMMANSLGASSRLSARKLTRTESTFGEDIFDESLSELSSLNQRHLLRQQWYRKNNLVSRLRRSTSTASNSSSSSSSGVYSNCSANTSSFASSFSSSFATLSSLSESCDANECTVPPVTESEPYPRILRRSSFKNKFSNCYKPYTKPRRLSLQLLKTHMEIPENFKFYPSKGGVLDLNSQAFSSSINPRFFISNDKESGSLYTMADQGTTKSNPSSPNKSLAYVSSDGVVSMSPGEGDSSMAAQIVITDSSPGSGSSQPAGVGTVSQLVRSKSLDGGLNTLLFYSNLCPSAAPTGDTGGLLMAAPMVGQQSASHYASFNRIFTDSAKFDMDPSNPSSGPPFQLLNFSGPSSHPPLTSQPHLLSTPEQSLGGFGSSSASNMKGMSFSSHEISNAGNNSIAEQSLSSTNNASLCDIENVMKKISSLRV